MKKIYLNRALTAKKKIFLFCACAALLAGCSCKPAEDQTQHSGDKPVVYMTRDISYEALGRKAEGKVAVKISTGEAGGHNYLKPALIEQLVKKVNGTIVECNTAYPGKRNTFEAHWQTIKDHGFLDIAPVDLMDEERGQYDHSGTRQHVDQI